MNSLKKIQIPRSIVDLTNKEVINGLSKAQDEISNLIHEYNNRNVVSRIGLDITIKSLRGIREYVEFLNAINETDDDGECEDDI